MQFLCFWVRVSLCSPGWPGSWITSAVLLPKARISGMSHRACLSDGSESVLTLGPIDYQLIAWWWHFLTRPAGRALESGKFLLMNCSPWAGLHIVFGVNTPHYPRSWEWGPVIGFHPLNWTYLWILIIEHKNKKKVVEEREEMKKKKKKTTLKQNWSVKKKRNKKKTYKT